VSDGI